MQGQKLLLTPILLAILLLGSFGGPASAQSPNGGDASAAATILGTGFTYQGQLIKDGVPANGSCDLRFTLYDASSGGSPVGSLVQKLAVTLTGGLFTVPDLDFGSGSFSGQRRWLQVEVSCPASGTPSYTVVGAVRS